MYNILTLNKISKKGLSLFPGNYKVFEKFNSPHAIIVRSSKIQNVSKMKDLLAIARAGSGTNNIPIDECTDFGIAVFNTPSANSNAVKELVIAGILLSSRKIIESINWLRDSKDTSLIEKSKSLFAGTEISGKTLGIIGLGAIGTQVALAGSSLGMQVIGHDPFLPHNNLNLPIQYSDSLEHIFTSCNYVSLHVPLNGSTKHMINSNVLSNAKPGISILNFSRAEIVDFSAISAYIENGSIHRYVTDFPTEDLLSNNNVIAIPHLGASTKEAEDNCAIMAVEEIIDFLENGNTKNSVNFPNMQIPRNENARLCILCKNAPHAENEIKSLLSEQKIKIENIQSRTKNNFIYTIIDTKNPITESAVQKVNAFPGIIKIRNLPPIVNKP